MLDYTKENFMYEKTPASLKKLQVCLDFWTNQQYSVLLNDRDQLQAELVQYKNIFSSANSLALDKNKHVRSIDSLLKWSECIKQNKEMQKALQYVLHFMNVLMQAYTALSRFGDDTIQLNKGEVLSVTSVEFIDKKIIPQQEALNKFLTEIKLPDATNEDEMQLKKFIQQSQNYLKQLRALSENTLQHCQSFLADHKTFTNGKRVLKALRFIELKIKQREIQSTLQAIERAATDLNKDLALENKEVAEKTLPSVEAEINKLTSEIDFFVGELAKFAINEVSYQAKQQALEIKLQDVEAKLVTLKSMLMRSNDPLQIIIAPPSA